MRQESVVVAKDVKIQNTINTDASGWIVVSMLLILQIIAVAPVAYYDARLTLLFRSDLIHFLMTLRPSYGHFLGRVC